MIEIFLKDDVKKFKHEFGHMIKMNNIHFGRYSLLSSLYIFNCKKILSVYERKLLKNFNKPKLDLGYIGKIDDKFALLVKLNVVFYLDDSNIHPIEILLMQNKYKKAVKVQKYFDYKEICNIEKLIEANTDKVFIKDSKLKKKPLTKLQKIAVSIIAFISCSIIAVLSILGVNFVKKESNLKYSYRYDLNGYEVSCGMFYNPETIDIKSEYNSKPVVSINGVGFNSKLLKITIPSSIINVTANSFEDCKNLTTIELIDKKLNIEHLNVLKNNSTITVKEYYYANLIVDDEIVDVKLFQYEQYNNFDIFNKEGYSFNGWYDSTKQDALQYANKNGQATKVLNIRENINLYAQYSLIDYQIKLDFNGGEEFDYISTYNIESDDVELPNSTRVGYSFAGWMGTKIATPTKDFIIRTGNTGDFELRAKWTPNLNKVVFNGNGATSGEMTYQLGESDSTITIKSNAYKKQGYTFAGWSTTADGEIEYLNNVSFRVGIESEYNLYAIWQPNLNNIIFNGNGATSGEMTNQQGYSNSTINLEENRFVRVGYTFAGWSTTADGEIEYLNKTSFEVGIESEYNLYAIWQPNLNNIVFNGNGATSGEMENQQGYSDSTIKLNANMYQKEGYTFAGWSTTENGEVEFNDESTLKVGKSLDNVLYAVWQPNLNTIVFNGNGSNSGEMPNQEGYSNSTITLGENKFVREGYTFIGWSTTANGEVEYNNKSTFDVGLEKEYILYAVWVEGELYFINNEDDFINLTSMNYNEYDEIRLMKNLDFNNSEISNFSYFTTIFNGNGFKISNIKLTNKAGLFKAIENATIKNLGLENIQLTATTYSEVGGLVGYAYSSVIEKCYTTGNISVNRCNYTQTDTRVYVGGLVGVFDDNTDNSIIDSFSKCNITAKANRYAYAGGILGEFVADKAVTITIENCYATGNISTYAYTGQSDSRAYSSGLIGGINRYAGAEGDAIVNVLNCFATGNLETYAGQSNYNYSVLNISNVITNIQNCYAENSQQYTHNGTKGYDSDRDSSSKSKGEILSFISETWDSDVWEFSGNDYPTLKIFKNR